MPHSHGNGYNGNGQVKRNPDHLEVNSKGEPASVGVTHPYPIREFNRDELQEIQFHRDRHCTALDYLRRRYPDVLRVVREGPTLPQDTELVRMMGILALWEVREQHFLHEMYLTKTD
jgi:hypothetical protein